MKTWFPLTDYDFYAYIAAGTVVIAAIDYCLADAVLVHRQDWTVVQGIFWVMMSYLAGHMLAGPSALLMEHIILKKMFANPTTVILGDFNPRWRERILSHLFATEFRVFPAHVRTNVCGSLSKKMGDQKSDPEDAFQCAFGVARYEDASSDRLNSFMNNYGMCRNVSFSFLIATGLLAYKYCVDTTETNMLFVISSLVLSIGMFGRYVKFYSAYTREVFRSFDRATRI